MGQAGSAVPSSDCVNLDSIARSAVVQTFVQGMIDAAVEKATNNMVEREKIRIRALEERVVREIETLEVTVSSLKHQKKDTAMESLKMRQLKESVEKLETRVGALEISIDTVKMIIPEAKALVESFLKQTNTTAEVTIQSRHVDNSSEGANTTISTSSSPTPVMSFRCADEHTQPNSESTPSTAGVSSNPSFCHKSSSSATDPTIQTNETLPNYESTPTSTTAFSSARSNPALDPTTPSFPPALIQTSDTHPVYESTSLSNTTFSNAHRNFEQPLTSAARNPLPPAFSGSRHPDSLFPSTSFNDSSPVGRNAQSASAHHSTALPRTAISSPSVTLPESQRKKSNRALHKNKTISTKLHEAVGKGRVEVVRKLLKEKVNINARGQEGMTAAHMAAMHGNAAILELLLLAGALVELRDRYDWQALHWAAKKDRTGRCVKLLLDSGAPPDERTCRAGDTPLHLAALEGNLAAAAELLRAGAKVGARNNRGETPLDLAPSGQMRKLFGAE